jgi:phosphatidate phosphatase LPIN
MFPPVNRKLQPEYTDFNYWRPAIPDIPLPDLTPASPALSATSESSRLGLLRNMATGIARRASRQTITNEGSKSPQSQTSRPTSPLVGPSIVAGDTDFDSMSESEDVLHDRTSARGSSMPGSLPGSFDDRADYLNEEFFDQRYRNDNHEDQYQRKDRNGNPTPDDEYDYDDQGGHSEDDVYPEMFDDDLLATGEMSKVPF